MLTPQIVTEAGHSGRSSGGLIRTCRRYGSAGRGQAQMRFQSDAYRRIVAEIIRPII